MKYFGTTLTTAGHYLFDLHKNGFGNTYYDFKTIPFNPEEYPKQILRGQFAIYHVEDYTILAYCGSPIDMRGGCKSVFIENRDLPDNEMIDLVMSYPIAVQIIEKLQTIKR